MATEQEAQWQSGRVAGRSAETHAGGRAERCGVTWAWQCGRCLFFEHARLFSVLKIGTGEAEAVRTPSAHPAANLLCAENVPEAGRRARWAWPWPREGPVREEASTRQSQSCRTSSWGGKGEGMALRVRGPHPNSPLLLSSMSSGFRSASLLPPWEKEESGKPTICVRRWQCLGQACMAGSGAMTQKSGESLPCATFLGTLFPGVF